MVYRELVTDKMLKQRVFDDCEACHMSKEHKSTPMQDLEREIKQQNQVIYVDFLFSLQNTSNNVPKAVLVIVDGFCHYTTGYPLSLRLYQR
ncbi:hypothetical protein PC129_g18315 [Phytophthora cactorum]|uniref:Uncharacterized protein n=1 Tax=Phytophthora cactorum TaxID=29920 RepID=A0A329RIM6_9STRA|nr:hypothetical protein Pcac1_g5753 [Phytophthora cactorum]KAG2803469.1 hypothetical protein PC112_g19157 [Phytophthora cactorum]KAG2803654.1 hypothetical protein PC111_g18592 [Phytophthora cactorum]KAG2840015.1 hypothetical protein PC113_g19351 [Phytophthora cactorum]KAG2884231.1 hypothetical protein PC114_g20201 [Phytophthora cactorum]